MSPASLFGDDHVGIVSRVIAKEMVAAGLLEAVAPTPAREAAQRIMAGENGTKVIRELVEQYRSGETAPTTPTTPRGPTSALPQKLGPYGGSRRSDDEIAANRVRIGTASGNPWAEDSINLTRQAMVRAADPDLAARLKREAGK